MYSFEYDVLLSGYDQLRLQGIPTGAAPQGEGSVTFTNGQLHSLAGEAYCCPVITTVLYAYWLNPWGDWWKVYASTI